MANSSAWTVTYTMLTISAIEIPEIRKTRQWNNGKNRINKSVWRWKVLLKYNITGQLIEIHLYHNTDNTHRAHADGALLFPCEKKILVFLTEIIACYFLSFWIFFQTRHSYMDTEGDLKRFSDNRWTKKKGTYFLQRQKVFMMHRPPFRQQLSRAAESIKLLVPASENRKKIYENI